MSNHTPGPWRFELNPKGKRIELNGGVARYDLHVMDFVRWGMGNAAPRFNAEIRPNLNVMKRAEEYCHAEPGREHHKDWHRVITHPDANLIEAAPAMHLCLEMLAFGVARIERFGSLQEFCFDGFRYMMNGNWNLMLDVIGWRKAEAAVKKARGG